MTPDPVTAMKFGTGLILAVKSLLAAKDSYDKQHIDLLRTKTQMLVELVETYKEENENLITENTKLHQELSRVSVSEHFVESRTVLFKRNVDGTYSNIPHCPTCKTHMSSINPSMPYRCNNKDCGYVSSLKGRDLKSALPSE